MLGAAPPERRLAASLLRGGGLVAFPTETVYGLGAAARDEVAIRRLFAVKGRPADNPVIVHIAHADDLLSVAAVVPPLARDLAARFWPGPLTLVLDARDDVPTVTTGGLTTVGVRVPDHPLALALLREAAIPVAAPSANRSGRPSPTTAAHVVADLGEDVDAVLDGGPSGLGVESTVVDARGTVPVVLREGMVTREDLASVVGAVASRESDRASPGTRYRHYAPRCRVEIAAAGGAWAHAAALAAAGRRVGLVAAPGDRAVAALAAAGDPLAVALGSGAARWLGEPADAADLARLLYRCLRAAEDQDVEVVVVEAVPDEGIGRAVMDRLRRAAASS